MKRWFLRLTLAGLLAVLAVAAVWSMIHSGESNAGPSPLVPRVERTWSVRFDPSYYYRNQRPASLARELAQRWESAGVNLVFFRALDPAHGTFYRTGYEPLAMGDFGRFDLLKHVIEECHERQIKVFAWLPVLNESAAWEANPAWRVKDATGEDHSEKGLDFPLCVNNPEVRQWWLGLVEDLLDAYPELDGVDLGEPVLSWGASQTCQCGACAREDGVNHETAWGARSEALMQLLGASVDAIHRHGRSACVTAVQSAGADGSLWTFDEMRRVTGFDWPALVAAPAGQRPDMICPELIWQEWHSSHGASSYTFTPEWTGQAVEDFLAALDTPIPALVHVELTDFPRVAVAQNDLRASISAALRGGAQGIDVYSTHELDRKSAWSAMRALKEAAPVKECLVVHDTYSDRSDAVQTAELLRHFNVRVTHRSVDECAGHALGNYDNIFYVGTDARTSLPDAFLDSLADSRATICWLGNNIEQALSHPALAAKWAIDFAGTFESEFGHVQYKEQMLKKEDPWASTIRIRDEARSRVWATAHGPREQSAPYAVQSGRFFWHFADVPTSYAMEGSHYLVFADLLHEILNENHAASQVALVRIEDVHPLSDPRALRQLADFLEGEDVPFQVAAVPIYAFPEQDIYVRTSERPDYVSAMRQILKSNGSIVMHGTTHQRFDETTSDYEYWDAVGDHPVQGETPQSVQKRIEDGLHEFWRAGLYPLAWETPHYAGSQTLYGTVSQAFSVAYERRQSIDQAGTDELFPYLIQRDRFGQMVVPENLGYIPLSDRRADLILEPARNMKVVRDGVASFFYHPFLGLSPLKEIVRGMKEDGYEFASISQLPVRVSTASGIVANYPAATQLQTFGREGQAATLSATGLVRQRESVAGDLNEQYHRPLQAEPGQLASVHFLPALTDGQQAAAQAASDPQEALQVVANPQGEKCRIPWPLLLSANAAHEDDQAEERVLLKMFDLLGVEVEIADLGDFSALPAHINLVLVPSAAARQLSEEQADMLVQALRAGQASIMTSGFSDLSDALMIEKTDAPIAVSQVRDNYYSESAIDWGAPRETYAFEAPGDADYIYSASDHDTPVVVGAQLDNGSYLFSSAAATSLEQYPYFLSHMLRYLSMYPLIHRSGFDIYFNPGDRPNVDIENLVKQWKRSGVQTVYAAAWHRFPEWTYDYARLIDLAHNNGMRVHAWFGLPYINEQFWMEHPQWRRREVDSEEPDASWRKGMLLEDVECREAARREMAAFLEEYNWDGVVFDRARFQFDDVLAENESDWLAEVIEGLEGWRRHNQREIIAAGLPDNDSPEEIALLASDQEADIVRVVLDTEVQRGIAPSSAPPARTGLPLYAYLHSMLNEQKRVALDSESSIYEVDRLMLPFLAAGCARERWMPEGIEVTSPRTVEAHLPLARTAGLAMNGHVGASFHNSRLILPVGTSRIVPLPPLEDSLQVLRSQSRLVDLTGDLLSERLNSRGLELDYADTHPCILVLSDAPARVWLDGAAMEIAAAPGLRGFTLELPAGRHHVLVRTRGISHVALAWGSLFLSNGIVIVSSMAILGFIAVIILTRMRRRRDIPAPQPALDI